MPNTPYLERQLIEAEFIITDERIKIWSEAACTSYINITAPKEQVALKEIEQTVKEIRKICREHKIKLTNQKKFKDLLANHYEHYVKQLEENQIRYAEIKKLAHLIQERGLHYGTTDDEVLKEMTQIRFAFEKTYHFNTSYSFIAEGYKRISALKEKLITNESDTYRQVSL